MIFGIGLSVFAIGLTNSWHELTGLTVSGFPSANNIDGGKIALVSTYPRVSVPLMIFATLTFTTPVILLYVYDKNNGVLEYFLSLGMDQKDIYMSYLKGALLLASSMLAYEVAANISLSVASRADELIVAEESALAVAIGLPVVSLVTIVMMAFSTMQKQRVGSNQPLGIGIGVLMVLPTYFVPFLPVGLVLPVELTIAGVIVGLSLLMFLLASSLIRREKLLP